MKPGAAASVFSYSPDRPGLPLKEIVRPILPHLLKVEERLEAVARDSDGILSESSRYVLCGGGKRIRAALVLFGAVVAPEAPGDRAPAGAASAEDAAAIAAAVELIHSATLVHDDIVDRAVLRRLKPAVNIHFGEEVAVLLGDFLYSKAFEMIARVGDPVIDSWIAGTTRVMCEGELDQLRHRFQPDLTLEEYFSFIDRKTASLIACCARAGGRLGGLGKREQESLADFGRNAGISFQIVDDILDLVGTESRIGKTLRTDAGNGKMTLPLILLRESLRGPDRDAFERAIRSPSREDRDFQRWIQSRDIIEQAERRALEYFDRAGRAIAGFDPGVRVPLEQLSRFLLYRDY
ncbi:MAG: hypothetical protein A2902_07700 [Elusimicrobia bacterium RIFCSPLOWO2_01_FULL_64_13]|nr:MAG: hypothetical protein A2902_07700 [Elusimicrobia bacterium RIFCSPLOWO2_01_FULL_64_13]